MTRSPAWNDTENAALVALYFSMLDKAISGQPYNKAAMIRSSQNQPTDNPSIPGGAGLKLAPLANRSKQSIEFKLMNASACHASLVPEGVTMDGYGYRAMPNYQAALKDAMRNHLEQFDLAIHSSEAGYAA